MGSVDACCTENSSLPFLDWSKSDEILNTNIRLNSSLRPGDEPGKSFGSVYSTGNNFKRFSTSLLSLNSPKSEFRPNGALSGNIRLNVAAAAEETVSQLDDDLVSKAIGDLLPDDEELFAGITDGLDSVNLNLAEETEDVDLFSSLGGIEMDGETQDACLNGSRSVDGFYATGIGFHSSSTSAPGSVVGEHPYGEHPSRTLFVRNINSNVEDSELRALFEHYGDIRTLYTACKHRGFVMISYYDIRAARTAMRALQNKPLRRRKLDIHFSIPKDNPSDKDINQGTLVVFNLDASVSNDDLRQIFGQYGEVKEIRETPHKRHHKFIEFYDVRAAEAALRALNRSDIAGKRIKLEPSRPGGARRSLMQQLSQDLDHEDLRLYRQQSSPPVANSPPGYLSSWGNFGSPGDSASSRPVHHALGTSVPNMSKPIVGLPVPAHSNPIHVGTIGSHLRSSQIDASLSSLQMNLAGHYAHSLPEFGKNMLPLYNSPTVMPIRGTTGHGPLDSEGIRLPRSNSSDVPLFDHIPAAMGIANAGSHLRSSQGHNANSSLSGHGFPWGNSSCYSNASYMVWPNPLQLGQSFSSESHGQQPQIFRYAMSHGQFANNTGKLQVGSAPSGDPSLLERHIAYLQESHDSAMLSANGMNVPASNGPIGIRLNSSLGIDTASIGSTGLFESCSLPHHKAHVFAQNGMVFSGRISRSETTVAQADNKKQYQLDIERILRGEDNRTTLMIKNIPNKYTSKMLLAAIDEQHRGMYDFLYLPIDFKNKCNVGYAFINMTSPKHIIPIYQAFSGKKWEKFNSEKVASLAYARIQGKAALVAHFQNSSLMNEDKRCRPILFHSPGAERVEQPLFVETITQPGMLKDQIGSMDPLNSTKTDNGNQESHISESVSIT